MKWYRTYLLHILYALALLLLVLPGQFASSAPGAQVPRAQHGIFTSTDTQTPAIERIGSIAVGVTYDVQVVDSLAYVVSTDTLTGTGYLKIIDVSNPISPTLRSSLAIPDLSPMAVQVVNTLAYIAGGTSGSPQNGLRIVDVSNPISPTLRGAFTTPAVARGLHVVGSTAYIAADQLYIINVNNPMTPTLQGSFNSLETDTNYAVQVVNTLAYVAAGSGGLQIVDVSNPLNPTLRGSHPNSGEGIAVDAQVVGDLVYLSSFSPAGDPMLLLDVHDPAAPVLRDRFSVPSLSARVVSDLLYVAGSVNGVTILDATNPSRPRLARFPASETGSALTLDVVGDLIYLANYADGLTILRTHPERFVRARAFMPLIQQQKAQ